MKEDL